MLHLRNCSNCLFNKNNHFTLLSLSCRLLVGDFTDFHCKKLRKNGFVCKYYCEVPKDEKNNKI